MNLRRRPTHSLIVILGAALACVSATGAATAAVPAKPVKPAVHTGKAVAITYQSAVLTGAVNPGGGATTYFFQYGATARYGRQSLPAALPGARRVFAVKSPIAGLAAKTTYHYRIVAVNAAATTLGADAAFTTPAIPLSLTIAGVPNPVQFGSPLSVAGTLTGTGAANREVVLQQNPYPYTTGFQNLGNPLLTTATGGFGFNLFSLPVTTQFRVVSVGAGPPVLSPVLTEQVQLAVSMRVTRHHTHRGYVSARFSGLISPPEVGALVSLQRLVGSQWKMVKHTTSVASSPGSSRYAVTRHLHRGGYYRVYVAPVEGGHIANVSPAMLVHAIF